jgi:hypothetical protein
MWEAHANPEGFADLLSWVCDEAVPAVETNPLHVSSEVFTSADDRIVVISRWHGAPEALAEPPRRLVVRPPHSWDFSPVDR